MSSFTDPLTVVQTRHGWMTLRDINYWTDCECDREDLELPQRCRTCITVPAGFETDFASIPQLFWSLFGHPAGRYAQAAVLHDYLYQAQTVPRKRADDLFLEAMQVLEVPAWQRWAMWSAVRVGGAAAYSLSSQINPPPPEEAP